jgi:hypothetical protein
MIKQNTIRIFESTPPSTPEDVARASNLRPDECPRRYCWWWRSLSFEWDISLSEGCVYDARKHPRFLDPSWTDRDAPCCRRDPTSSVDRFESRDPHLEEDGFNAKRWQPD